jgi:hypothetical protein
VRKCPRCGLVSPDRSVRCECGFLLEVMTLQLQQAIKLLQISREELGDTIRDEILENPILEDAVLDASEEPKTVEAADALLLNGRSLDGRTIAETDEWPFDQAANVMAVSDAAVFDEGAPVLMVSHYSEDHSWAFLSGRPFAVERGKLVRMSTVLRHDPSLRSVADLQPGWTATRAHVGEPWVYRADPEV